MTPFFMVNIKACAKDLKLSLNCLFDYGKTIWDRCLINSTSMLFFLYLNPLLMHFFL